MVREILVDWSTINGGGKISVMYFAESDLVSTQRSQLAAWLANLEGGLHASTEWSIRTSGRELDTASGTLIGAWVDPTVHEGAGTDPGGQPVPDATQALIRWHTDSVVDGRFLRGRTYVPGLANGNVVGGNVNPAVVTSYTTDSQAFADTAVGFGVWHRPTNGVGGVLRPVSVAECWSEFAVQRRRRG